MGLLRDSDWEAAFIGGAAPAFPWLRKTFTLKQKPRQATAFVNSLGYYELYVNGRKVDDHVLSPAVSDYSKRTFYVTHDVTNYLVEGANCIALWLGRGWYVKGHPGVIHDGPLVRAQLDLAAARWNHADESPPMRPGKSAPARSLLWAKERPSATTAASTTTPAWNWMAGIPSGWTIRTGSRQPYSIRRRSPPRRKWSSPTASCRPCCRWTSRRILPARTSSTWAGISSAGSN